MEFKRRSVASHVARRTVSAHIRSRIAIVTATNAKWHTLDASVCDVKSDVSIRVMVVRTTMTWCNLRILFPADGYLVGHCATSVRSNMGVVTCASRKRSTGKTKNCESPAVVKINND